MSPHTIPEEHKVRLDVFDGPLDLLLYLIKKDEVDIYNIPIELIADQYMAYLNLMKMLDLNIAGEFIVMAATLMLIKSRMLLPPEERPEVEEEEDDPRWELVKQLVQYKKFKEAAMFLEERERHQENVFAPGGDGDELEAESTLVLDDVSIFDLIGAFNTVLERLPEGTLAHLSPELFTVADKIEVVLNAVALRETVAFFSLFESVAERQEIVCTFLAILELIRMRHIRVTQKGLFGEIVLMKGENG